jgi:hypothetical protein
MKHLSDLRMERRFTSELYCNQRFRSVTGRRSQQSEWVPRRTVGELQVPEIGSKSQTDA